MVEHNPRATLPEDAEFVHVTDGAEKGYWGIAPDQTDNEAYTFAGQAERLEQARKDETERQRKLTEPAKDDEKPEPRSRRTKKDGD